MIEIRLLDERSAAEACAAADLPVNGGLLVYAAAESGVQTGVCLFGIAGDKGRLYRIMMNEDNDCGTADGLMRAALSLMARRGAAYAECIGGVDTRLLRGTGFCQSGGAAWRIDFKDGFAAACHCGGKA